MGYTHYWTIKEPKRGQTANVEKDYQLAIKACNKIVKTYQEGVTDSWNRLSGFSAHCKPGQYGGLKVNGKAELSHEDFCLREHYKQNREPLYPSSRKGFNFCKTANKPYDDVVTACLIVLKHYLKDNIDVNSDGMAHEWLAGLDLARRATKLKTLSIPEGIEHNADLRLA